MDGEWQCERCTLMNSNHYRKCKACYASKPRQEPSLPDVSHFHPVYYNGESQQQHGTRIGWSADVCPDQERRIVFLGRTGSGKSATGNNILNYKAFESSACGSSVTRKCQRGRAKRFNCDVHIIDSPGLFDTEMTNADITREVVKCVAMTAPGPHAFVLVVRIDRFTKEENDTVQHFKQVFGEGILKHLILLFTRKDDLAHEGKTLSQYLQKVPQDLQQLAKACNNRCIAFNNRGPQEERDHDVQGFLNLVDAVIVDNGGNAYTSGMFEEAEKNMKKREEALRREHERKVAEEKDAIRREFESKFKRQQQEQAHFAKQLQRRIAELEQEKTVKSDEEEIESLCKDMRDLKLALRNMGEEKRAEDRKVELERLRKENEALKKLDADKKDFREEAREEVNKEKSDFMGFLGSVLPTLVSAVLPAVFPVAGKLIGKFIK